jgi:hypothetical protein
VTDQPETLSAHPVPAAADGTAIVAPVAPAESTAGAGIADERPELLVGGAFAGGILLALILKRLGR